MLRNTHNFLTVIVTYLFLVLRVSADEYELEVNSDTKEDQLTSDKQEIETNENIKGNKKVIKITPIDAENNINYEDTSEKKNTHGGDQKSYEDTHEILSKFVEKHKPLWKDVPHESVKRQEPGFDLTSAEKKKFKIWHNGVIPYYIDVVSFSDKVLRDRIRNQLQLANYVTGLNFMELLGPPSDDNERWVFFVNRRGLLGCGDHSVRDFTNQGVQQVVLGYDCIETRGEIAEAVMTIAGVPAQHNAPDRDHYIQVNMENIMPDKKIFFEKLEDNEWLFHDLKYDFDSITHYDIYKYSANGRPTVQPKNTSTDCGLSIELSPTDVLKIKMLYNYVAKTVKLESGCEKIFQRPSKFERFVPHQVYIKPRKKPARYLKMIDNHMVLSGTSTYRHEQYVKSLQEKYIHFRNTSEVKYKNENINNHNKAKEKILNVTPYKEAPKIADRLNSQRKEKPYHKIPKSKALEILSDYQTDV